MVQVDKTTPPPAALKDEQRKLAMERFDVLRPHLEDDVPLARAARNAGISVRTAERWLARYRRMGLVGLARSARSDADAHHLPPDLVALIEGMGLKKPRASAAAIHRRINNMAKAHGWPVPSYGTVYAILAHLDPAMVTLAHEGASAFRNRYELIHRHRADTPNAIWQADHTMLDLVILDQTGKPVRPWLTTVIDDHSRAVAGIMVFFGAPSILNTSLALRQAIWRKGDPAWPVCGIPDVLYVDHGSDFTSNHLDQVAASLRFRIVYSAVARPQELDLLLVMHAKPRTVRRDGIHFQGLRYSHTTLASYVGDDVTIRYDPRDLSEIRVFDRNKFLCRAISEEHAGEAVTLKDIQAARRAHRRSLRSTINERVARVVDFLPVQPQKPQAEEPKSSPRGQRRTKLRIYQED